MWIKDSMTWFFIFIRHSSSVHQVHFLRSQPYSTTVVVVGLGGWLRKDDGDVGPVCRVQVKVVGPGSHRK